MGGKNKWDAIFQWIPLTILSTDKYDNENANTGIKYKLYFGIRVFSFGQNCPHYHIISLQCESFYLKEDSNCSRTYHASRKKGQCLATSRTRSTSITEEQTQLLSISLIMAKTCFSLVSSFCKRQNKWHVNNLRHPCIKCTANV